MAMYVPYEYIALIACCRSALPVKKRALEQVQVLLLPTFGVLKYQPQETDIVIQGD